MPFEQSLLRQHSGFCGTECTNSECRPFGVHLLRIPIVADQLAVLLRETEGKAPGGTFLLTERKGFAVNLTQVKEWGKNLVLKRREPFLVRNDQRQGK